MLPGIIISFRLLKPMKHHKPGCQFHIYIPAASNPSIVHCQGKGDFRNSCKHNHAQAVFPPIPGMEEPFRQKEPINRKCCTSQYPHAICHIPKGFRVNRPKEIPRRAPASPILQPVLQYHKPCMVNQHGSHCNPFQCITAKLHLKFSSSAAKSPWWSLSNVTCAALRRTTRGALAMA